jgi:hypothetical protein
MVIFVSPRHSANCWCADGLRQYTSEDDLLGGVLRALEQQEEDLAAVTETVDEW